MKKILATLLAVSSVSAFAVVDSFQSFNNNAYVSYGLMSWLSGPAKDAQYNTVGLGATFQSRNDIWANAEVMQGNQPGDSSNVSGTIANLRAGYAFQWGKGSDTGFQVIPYAQMGAYNNNNYLWGVGAKPEARFFGDYLKLSMATGLIGYNGGQPNPYGTYSDKANTTVLGYYVTPSVQYNIAKTIMLGVDYNFFSSFNGDTQNATGNTLVAKVGYLF